MKNLTNFLEVLRNKRNFNAALYVDKKITAINDFFRSNSLDAAVIGLSGGIDSAITASLLVRAMTTLDSPIKKVTGVIAPIVGNGTTGQNQAKDRALALCKKVDNKNFEYFFCNLTTVYEALQEQAYPMKSTDWSDGQMASVFRTPVFYWCAAMLQDKGFRSLVVGTTNRDEGSYIGFFGKASDGMVDLQPIADIHKSEVYKVAEFLGDIPESIMTSIPKGDVYDGKVDEEMIGAPYWFLEMYLLQKEYHMHKECNEMLYKASKEEVLMFADYSKAIEQIHNKNKHKYQVGSPAHFIDVMERKIEGGWK